jgi:hypothetical protein
MKTTQITLSNKARAQRLIASKSLDNFCLDSPSLASQNLEN